MKLKCYVDIKNVPKYVADGSEKGFIVARIDLPDLWYYGVFDTLKKATDTAEIVGDCLIFEIEENDAIYQAHEEGFKKGYIRGSIDTRGMANDNS